MFCILVFIFLFSRNVHSVLPTLPSEKDKIAHRTEGRHRIFALLLNSMLTEKAPDNDKILHSTRGLVRPPLRYFRKYQWEQGCLGHSPGGQLAHRLAAPTALHANAPLRCRVRRLYLVKN